MGGDNQLGAFNDDIIHALANRIDKFADRITQLIFQFFGRSADHGVEDQPLLTGETETFVSGMTEIRKNYADRFAKSVWLCGL